MKKLMTTLLLLLALPALAQKPTIQLMPFAGAFVPAAAACGFDVLVTPQAGRPNKERLIQFNNTAIIAGPLFVTLKNLSTGKTIDINSSSSAHFTFSDTTTIEVTTGLTSSPLPADVAAAAGLPLLFLIRGRMVFTIDDQGNITSVQSVTGKVEDVCQLLQ
jgi:hypothetical protein